MRISSKLEGGMIALVDIAINSKQGQSVSACGISERHNISLKYLEQILIMLRQAGIIKSVKGSKGGYLLCREPEKINLSEIINALDITFLNSEISSDNADSVIKKTINNNVWQDMTNYLHKYCSNVSLKNLMEKCSNAMSEYSEIAMYYI